MNKIKRVLNLDLPQGQSAFLWGARKTGKSTYLKSTFPKAHYIDLLKADEFHKYTLNPHYLREELLILKESTQTPLVIIDEVQKVPILLNEVHWLIENSPFDFILCGSSSRKLRSTGANFLGGRAWSYQMMPLCYPEIKELNWSSIFNNGLIPQHYFSPHYSKMISSYLFDYIMNEVQHEANLRKIEPFARFLDILGFCQGEMLNFTSIGRECGINTRTARSYFDILEDMYIGYFLYPYRKKAKRQTIQETPKFYLFDTGVANHLKRYSFKEMKGSEAGKAFEHYVFLELMAYKKYHEKTDSITYWRTKEGYEVDFVIQDKAYEVKLNDSFNKKDIRGLLAFGDEYKAELNIITTQGAKRITKVDDKKITVWPISDFLEDLWSGLVW
ncbi:MAG: AAA family ATPase [Rickettsiales bacterium]|nr:AAA family ATPase [Rickettsiales bacterium]|tara:strand:- start:1269 stop:2429 length:1161 start_codon:yes stop_codon:yes gene_type:complete